MQLVPFRLRDERRTKLKRIQEKPKKEQIKMILAIILSVAIVVLVWREVIHTYKHTKQEQMNATVESVYAKDPSAENLVLLWAQLTSNNSRDIYHYLDDAFSADNAELEPYLSKILDENKDASGWNFKAMYLSSVLARCSYDEDFSRFAMIFEKYIPQLPVLYTMVGISSMSEFFNKKFVYENHEAILGMLNEIADEQTEPLHKVLYYEAVLFI